MREESAQQSLEDGFVRTSSAEIRARQAERGGENDTPPDDTPPPPEPSDEVSGEPQQDPESDASESLEQADEGVTGDAGADDAKYRSIDDVARRHAADNGAPPEPPQQQRPKRKARGGKKKRSSRKRGTSAEPAPPTPVEETGVYARSSVPTVQVRTAMDEVPYEGDPSRDPGVVSVGPIEPAEDEQFPDMSGSEVRQPANLTDICRLYRLGRGDGDCFLRVERKKPPSYQGTPVSGYIGKIRRPIDEAEFRDMAGGGLYELVVHGPNPRGDINPYTGTVEIKPLTKPIRIEMPGRPHFVNFDDDDEAAGRQNDMQGWDPMERRGRTVPATSADAQMYSTSVKMIQDTVNKTAQEKEKLQEKLDQLSNRPPVEPHLVDAFRETSREQVSAVRESAKTTVDMLREQVAARDQKIDRLESKLDELTQSKQGESAREYDGVARLVSALNPTRDTSGDVQRIYDQHTREVDRIREQHDRAMQQLRDSYDDRMRSKDEELRRAAEHYDKREQQLRDEAVRRERELKEEQQRRERDLKEHYDSIIARQKDDHIRELEQLKRQEELVRETHKVSYETRIANAEERARLAHEEAERAREQAEKKGNLPEMIEEYGSVAEILGYKKGAGEDAAPQDWKEWLAKSVGNAFENLPTILERVGDTMQSRAQMMQSQTEAMRVAAASRALPAPQQRPAQRPQRGTIRGQGGVPATVQRPTGWATEDGVPSRHVPAPAPDMRPDQKPPPTEDELRRAEAERQHQAVHGGGGEPPGAGAATQAPPTPHVPPETRMAPSNGQALGASLPPGAADQMRQGFEMAFNQGTEPAEVARDLREAWGDPMLQNILGSVTVDQLVETLSQDPKAATSPLLTREGTAWFRQVWAEGERLLQDNTQ